MKKSVWRAIKRGDRKRVDIPRKRRHPSTIHTIHSALKDCYRVTVDPRRAGKYLHSSRRKANAVHESSEG